MRFFHLAALLLFACSAGAQEAGNTTPPAATLPDDVTADFAERKSEIDAGIKAIARLERALSPEHESMAEIQQGRIDAVRSSLFNDLLRLANDIVEQEEAGLEVGEFKAGLVSDLETMEAQMRAAIDRRTAELRVPDDDLAAAEQAVADRRMGQLYEKLDDLYGTLYSYTQVAADFGLDFSAQRDFLVRAVTESAANRSAILGLALNQAEVARAAASTVPDDTDLAGQESAAEARVQITASALESSVQLLNKLEIDSTHYRQQLVTVTGEVTADSLDISVIEGLLDTWRDDVSAFLSDDAPSVLFNVFIFLLILAAAFYVGKLVSLALSALMDSPQIQLSSLAENMIVKTARNAILFIGLLIALAQLGVSLGPVLAGLGIAGFIVGFALQDTLSNFASGLLILIYRPFDVGDYVTAGGVAGRVSNMSLVNTTFKTPDNETLIVPNNKVWQDVIKNTTAQLTRRVDLTFGISYDDDIDKAKEILLDAAKNYPAVLGEPPTDVRVNELADSSVNLLLRPWVNTSDYWDTYWDLIEIVKKRFDAEGITIPFPQRDVHTLGAAADETETAGKAPDAAKEVSVEHGNVTSRSKDGQDLAAAAPEGDDTSS